MVTMLRIGANLWEPDGFLDAEEGLTPLPMGSQDQCKIMLITSQMDYRGVAACLTQHGCDNLTARLDLRYCNNYPSARGGFSVVYKGALKDGQPVAIKCIESFNSNAHGIDVSEHGKNQKRMAREIYTWARCKHPGVLPMLGFSHFRGRIALITPWMGAGSLSQHILEFSLPPLRTCIQLVEAVEYLHTNGIVHADIKPANILVTDQGHVQLADFGGAVSALMTALDFTRTNSFNFTIRFAAPEVLQAESRTFTKESDIYALEMTMFNIMTGQPPSADKGDPSVIIEVVARKGQPTQPKFEHSLNGYVAKIKMWDLLKWCFAYEPHHRPKISQVKDALIEVEKLNSVPNEEVRDRGI